MTGAARRGRLASKRLVVGGVAALAAATGVIVHLWRGHGEPDCAHALLDTNDGIAVVVCEREYIATGDPTTGVTFANALRRSGDLTGATAIASPLVTTSARADALLVLGRIAAVQGRFDDARPLLRAARAAHLAGGATAELARDDQALADVAYRQNQLSDALRALDACLVEAAAAGDAVVEGYCHLAAGKILGEAGYLPSAQHELSLAAPLLRDRPRELGELAAQRGALYQLDALAPDHVDHSTAAIDEYEAAIAHTRRALRPAQLFDAMLNLTYSLAEAGRLDPASRELEAARALDPHGEHGNELIALEARIAYHRGDRARAFDLNNQVFDHYARDPDLEEDTLNIATMQARIALADRDWARAEAWAERGVAALERRRAQVVLEMRPGVMALRQQPYELWFTALARAHRFADAIGVVDRWYGRTVLDALSTRTTRSTTLEGAALHSESLRQLFPAWSAAPITRPLAPDALLARLAAVDAIALVVAEGELWRIAARDGQLAIVDVGAWHDVAPRVADFKDAPGDRARGEALGAALLGADAFRVTPRTLHVVLDGRLAGLPVAALRAHGQPLIAMRAIVRPPRLSEVDCVPAGP
ncbi:MAG TPA: hypothetical protein VFP84_35285, partial [Kofleriaceae bacterium]|nr:hypothetical protein [Kofleriaceae bacterium]